MAAFSIGKLPLAKLKTLYNILVLLHLIKLFSFALVIRLSQTICETKSIFSHYREYYGCIISYKFLSNSLIRTCLSVTNRNTGSTLVLFSLIVMLDILQNCFFGQKMKYPVSGFFFVFFRISFVYFKTKVTSRGSTSRRVPDVSLMFSETEVPRVWGSLKANSKIKFLCFQPPLIYIC